MSKLADDDFSPVYLRNATAYGVSRRLRADIVVNNLVGHAVTTGKVLLQSDGIAVAPARAHRATSSPPSLACLDGAPRGDPRPGVQRRQGRRELPDPRRRRDRQGGRARLRGRLRRRRLAGHPQLPRRLRKIETSSPASSPQWTLRRGHRGAVRGVRVGRADSRRLDERPVLPPADRRSRSARVASSTTSFAVSFEPAIEDTAPWDCRSRSPMASDRRCHELGADDMRAASSRPGRLSVGPHGVMASRRDDDIGSVSSSRMM